MDQGEDSQLKYLLGKHKYNYSELSRLIHRTASAIQRRACDLGIKDRPVRDPCRRWTEDDCKLLYELTKAGYGYELMAEKIGRSSKAIRGRVHSVYGTENLDKVRMMIGTGKEDFMEVENADERQDKCPARDNGELSGSTGNV